MRHAILVVEPSGGYRPLVVASCKAGLAGLVTFFVLLVFDEFWPRDLARSTDLDRAIFSV